MQTILTTAAITALMTGVSAAAVDVDTINSLSDGYDDDMTAYAVRQDYGQQKSYFGDSKH